MAGFARSNAPPSSGAYNPYASASGGGSGGSGGGYQPPTSRSNRVPPPSNSYPQEKASYGGGNQPTGGHLVVNCPSDLIFSNCLVLNPQEWGNTQYVMIDRRYVITAM